MSPGLVLELGKVEGPKIWVHCSWEVQMQKSRVTIQIRTSCVNNSAEALILFSEG